MFVWYLDAAVDRVEADEGRRFDDAIEAARLGRIFAADHKLYRRWLGRTKRQDRSETGLTGAGLEQHMAALHRSRPDIVLVRAS